MKTIVKKMQSALSDTKIRISKKNNDKKQYVSQMISFFGSIPEIDLDLNKTRAR